MKELIEMQFGVQDEGIESNFHLQLKEAQSGIIKVDKVE